jgi:hypothetical protein
MLTEEMDNSTREVTMVLPQRRRIPLVIKVCLSVFVTVLVLYYWRAYGPQNFLYFCDVALIVTTIGVWLESSLLISMEAVAILLPQMLWIADFVTRIMGIHFLGMTDYMFDPKLSLFVRGLSLFHGWLPILILWLLWRVGYDRRALLLQTICGVSLLLVCYFCFLPPEVHSARAFNINYVFGLDENHAQTKFPPLEWFGMLIVVIPVVLYVPAHLALSKLFSKPAGK